MLRHLRVRNLATIEDLELKFGPGFSVLTGETGAGKSILIDSIRLICGEKASADLIRTGAREAVVEASFAPAGGDRAPEEDGLTVQRVVSDDGAAKAYGDGILVPVRRLRELAGPRIDIYGQNDHVFLLRLESHRDYLDAFAGAGTLSAETAAAARELKALLRQREEWRSRERERHQRIDYLEYQIAEIEKAGVRPGEEAELRAEREVLRNAEKIRALVEQALGLADSEEVSLTGLASRLQTALGDLAALDPAFSETRDSLAPAIIALREAADFLSRYKDRGDDAEERLEGVEARLSVMEALKRKYGGPLDDIPATLDSLRRERDDLAGLQQKLEEADRAAAALFAVFAEKAGALSRARSGAAGELESLLEKEFSGLGMKKARFRVRIETRALGPEAAAEVRESGWDEIEFLISTNPGEDLKPMRKIASGGELSRIMLALKAVGRDKGEAETLIFDEIDAGVGGRTADFVAAKLRRLAAGRQVICITHLPQIASHADRHFRIEKRVEKDRTFTTVKALDYEERVEELARLMSGHRVTDLALAGAREMLDHNLKS